MWLVLAAVAALAVLAYFLLRAPDYGIPGPPVVRVLRPTARSHCAQTFFGNLSGLIAAAKSRTRCAYLAEMHSLYGPIVQYTRKGACRSARRDERRRQAS